MPQYEFVRFYCFEKRELLTEDINYAENYVHIYQKF